VSGRPEQSLFQAGIAVKGILIRLSIPKLGADRGIRKQIEKQPDEANPLTPLKKALALPPLIFVKSMGKSATPRHEV